MGYDVITSGYVSMDYIIKILTPAKTGCTSLVENADHNRVYYGGCSVNIAAALSKLGKRAMPLIRVGDDFEKTGFKAFLETMGIPLEGIRRVPGETTSTCYLLQDRNNDHITIYYPGSMDKKYAGEFDDSLFENLKYGVVTVASREDNMEFVRKCRKHQVPLVFGMKDDFDAFPEEFLKELICESRIIFMNETESRIITAMLHLERITELFELGKADYLITTLGKEGSICYERCAEGVKSHHIGVFRIPEVVDATGSGDAYMAGFLYGLLERRTIRECCCLGAALSSFVLQKTGCCTNLPDIRELEERAEQIS